MIRDNFEPLDDAVRIRGACEHNLKNIDLDIPRDQLVVITGPSGSGKSSLALDTLYAEGQRQYIESLSVHARQYLPQLQRPEVEYVDGLQPTICINQRPPGRNPRSTVATITEIYDYLRLLMARLGTPYCHSCSKPIHQQTTEEIQQRLTAFAEQTKVMIFAPMVRGRKGQHLEVFARIRKAGLLRARVDGAVYDLENLPELSPNKNHTIEAIIDRIIIRPGLERRLAESIQLAIRFGEGLMGVCYLDTEKITKKFPQGVWRDVYFSTLYACTHCEISYEEVEPRTFSFNSPYGACPICEGLGTLFEFDPQTVIPDRSKSLDGGAVIPWKTGGAAAMKKRMKTVVPFLELHKATWKTPLDKLSDKVYQQLLYGDDKKFLGILMLLESELATTTSRDRQNLIESFRDNVVCQACDGSRLCPEATAVRLGEMAIHEITAMNVTAAREFFDNLEFDESEITIADPILDEIDRRLDFLQRVGTEYLTLNRPADTLSGGELQRVRLATGIGSGLVGVCYVLDEPSIGLHSRDNQRLIDALRQLQQLGNTVVVVEHDEAMMRQADWLIDFGPGAGNSGGTVVACGKPAEVEKAAESLTGCYLAGTEKIVVPKKRRRTAKTRSIMIEGATMNNLKDLSVRFPLSALTCVTGVSGSGKSSLVYETLAPALLRRLGMDSARPGPYTNLKGVKNIDKIILIDQTPIGRTPRGNPATYTGAFDEIRKIFAGTRQAKQAGYTVGRFSFNVKGGRCEECQGQGVKKIEMNFLPDLYVTCPICQGARFNRQTLLVRYRGRSIADVLEMSIDESVEFFENFPNLHRTLQSLADVGLGYLKLGQPSTNLSGGEAQRVKLAAQLARVDTGNTLYFLDEPTTGLHFNDVRRLLDVLNRLVDKGNSIVVIEHNLDVIKSADWVIDLGPEGGDAGGFVVAEGTPETIAATEGNHTGECLKKLL